MELSEDSTGVCLMVQSEQSMCDARVVDSDERLKHNRVTAQPQHAFRKLGVHLEKQHPVRKPTRPVVSPRGNEDEEVMAESV